LSEDGTSGIEGGVSDPDALPEPNSPYTGISENAPVHVNAPEPEYVLVPDPNINDE